MEIKVIGMGYNGMIIHPVKGKIGSSSIIINRTGLIRLTQTQKVTFAPLEGSFENAPSCYSEHIDLTPGWKVQIEALSDPTDTIIVEAHAS
jgi:hypothetical protein